MRESTYQEVRHRAVGSVQILSLVCVAERNAAELHVAVLAC